MADAAAVNFQVETPAKAKAKAVEANKPVAENAFTAAPKAGDTFVPERGKRGVWHALMGDAAGLLAPVVTH